MQVTIEPIYHPIYRDRIQEGAKWLLINKGDASPIIKILIATTFRSFNGDLVEVQAIRGGERNVYEAHMVITTDILLSGFSVPKNRYHSNTHISMKSDYFLNSHVNTMIRSMGFLNIYEIELIKHGIVGTLSMVSGDTIMFIDGKYKTYHDLHSEKNLIRYKQLKHNFLDARIS